MATRLYFVASTVPSQAPAFDAGWTSTAEAVRRTLATTQAATTETLAGSVANTATALAVQLVSPPLTAQTISGTFSVVSRGREVATTDNVNQRWRSVRVYSGDGATLRGTLNSYAVTGSTTELPATFAGQPHAVNGSVSSVVCQDGDVIVVELGYGLSATGTTPQWEMALGGTGTDHTTSINDTTGTVPWVEFSANLVFAPSTFTGSGLAALSFTASATGIREVPGTAASEVAFAAAAAGTVSGGPGQVSGVAVAAFAFSASAAGTRAVLGVAAVTVPFDAAAAGSRTVLGQVAAPLGFSAAASGGRTVLGDAASSLVFSASLVGVRAAPGLGFAVFGFAAVASGAVSTPGGVVPRPDEGTTGRPAGGTTVRPGGGVTPRATGLTVRPYAGTTARP